MVLGGGSEVSLARPENEQITPCSCVDRGEALRKKLGESRSRVRQQDIVLSEVR